MQEREGARRPLLWLAGALTAGAGLGLEVGDRLGSHGTTPGPLPSAGVLSGLALGSVLVLLLLRPLRARGRSRSGSGRRAGPWPPAWSVLLFALAFLRGTEAPQPPRPPPREAGTPPPWATSRERPLVGRWHPWPGPRSTRGWLETPASEAGEPAAGLLFSIEGPPPAAGTWIVVHPGEPPVPWPRGPVPGPLGREGRFLALAELLPDEWSRLREPAPPLGSALFPAARAALRRRLDALPDEHALRGLLHALVLGEPSALGYDTADLFTRTGTRHLLAVSGLHVGLVAALLILPLARSLSRRLGSGRPHRIRTLALGLSLPLLLGYAGIAGAAPPVVRATVAVALGLLAPLLRRPSAAHPPRRPDPLSLWALALSLECLASPTAVTSVPVRLSYLATLGILGGTRPLTGLLRRLAGTGGTGDGEGALPHPIAHWWRIPLARLGRATTTALAASLAAVLATLPVIWTVFGEVAPLGVVATPLALLLVVPLLVGGWVHALAPGLLDPSGLVPWAGALLGLLDAADHLPGTPASLPPRPAALLWTATLLTFLALRTRAAGTGGRAQSLTRRLAALVWAVILVPWAVSPTGLELHVLDVGHGSCAVLRAPGVPALVFDAGSRNRRRIDREALFPLLRHWEVDHPLVALSHDHADHRAALGRLVERFPPRAWIGARPAHLDERLPHSTTLLDPSPGRVEVVLGAGGGALSIRLLRGATAHGNEGSRSLELVLGSRRVVLMGDAEAEGLRRVLEEDLLGRGARLLVLPHHGSDTPLLGALLHRVDPEEVWISASSFPAVGRELDRRRRRWAWTGRAGPLALFLPLETPDTSPPPGGAKETPEIGQPAPPSPLDDIGENAMHPIQPPSPPAGNRPPRKGPAVLGPVLAALALGAWGAPLEAQAPPPESGSRAREEPAAPTRRAEDRGSARILHLDDGRLLRVRARETERGWEIRQGRTWLPMRAGRVVRAPLEKDVLAQARGLEKELGRDPDPVRRVAWCDWCLREGLVEEALRSLDRILDAHPDQPDALALLRRRAIPLALPPLSPTATPAELSTFLAVAAKTGPAAQEIAVQRLGAAREIPGLPETLGKQLTASSPRQRKFATRVLRRLFPGRELRSLLRRSILDRSRDVRIEASLALRDVGDAAVILPAVRALGSGNATVRENAVQALTHMAYPAAVEPLYHHLVTVQSGGSRAPHANIFVGRQFSYVQDFDVEVASGAAVADPVINVGMEGAALDAAVLGATSVRFQTELENIRRGLTALTGADPGQTTTAWKTWWNEHGEEWKADRIPPGPRSSPRSPGD